MINNDKRSLSVRIRSETCKLLKLDRETFSRILGAIEQHLKKDYDHEFDKKIEEMKKQKRTLSQTFQIDEFNDIKVQRMNETKSNLTVPNDKSNTQHIISESSINIDNM